MDKLAPPQGYDSWIEYAIETMDTRTLHLDSCWSNDQWGRMVQGDEMRAAARAELEELRKGNVDA